MRECSPPQTCHMSHVTCHVSHVTCHVSHVACHVSVFFFFFFFFFGKSGEDYRWRVCYQRGLPRLVSIHSYMSLPCYSPSFSCPLSLSLISLQCLPNFVIPYFLSLEFHSPNFSPRFLSLNSSSPSLHPKCLFLNFLSHEFHFHNFSPRNIFLSDDDFTFIPHQDQ